MPQPCQPQHGQVQKAESLKGLLRHRRPSSIGPGSRCSRRTASRRAGSVSPPSRCCPAPPRPSGVSSSSRSSISRSWCGSSPAVPGRFRSQWTRPSGTRPAPRGTPSTGQVREPLPHARRCPPVQGDARCPPGLDERRASFCLGLQVAPEPYLLELCRTRLKPKWFKIFFRCVAKGLGQSEERHFNVSRL